MINFCTLFDSSYLSRGLTMYRSLQKHCADFHLFILPMDNICRRILLELDLPNTSVIPPDDFEDEKLLVVKSKRSRAEYCWTCASSLILYVLEKYDKDSCTYLDADICFWSNPKVLLDEIKDDSVLITEHRYTPKYDQTAGSGKYCVQFITFKNDERGLEVLKWWQSSCIDSCELNSEEGKCGDQKYLDDWTERFSGVHVLQHLGGGVAPWNIQQYLVHENDDVLSGKDILTGEGFDIIFYHFHGLKFYTDGGVNLSHYAIPSAAINLIYKPYVKLLEEGRSEIVGIDNTFDPHGSVKVPLNIIEKTFRFFGVRPYDNYDDSADKFFAVGFRRPGIILAVKNILRFMRRLRYRGFNIYDINTLCKD